MGDAESRNKAFVAMAASGRMAGAKALLQQGADPHWDDERALREASENGRTEMVKLLLDLGADVAAMGGDSLRNSAAMGHVAVVKLLLDHGAYINTEGEGGEHYSPLVEAIRHKNIGVAKELLSRGAAIGRGELSIATQIGSRTIIPLLLRHGAKAEEVSVLELETATRSGHTASVALILRAHGTKWLRENYKGKAWEWLARMEFERRAREQASKIREAGDELEP